jgi:hypothetical protein
MQQQMQHAAADATCNMRCNMQQMQPVTAEYVLLACAGQQETTKPMQISSGMPTRFPHSSVLPQLDVLSCNATC